MLPTQEDRSPSCHLYYATTGTWADQQPLLTRIEQGTSDLKRTSLFSSVSFMRGERVRFAVAAGPKGPIATEVEVIAATEPE